MLKRRPFLIRARLALAFGASFALGVGSLAEPAAAAGKTVPQSGRVDQNLEIKTTADPAAKVRVIITRDHHSNGKDVRDQGGKVISTLDLGNSTVAEVPSSRVQELANQPGVVRITYDAPVYVQAFQDPLDRLNLQSVYPLAVDAASQWNSNLRLRGTGIGVAVIDSGVRQSLPDFLGASLSGPGRVLELLSRLTGGPLSGQDDNGHGTFVAGIIAGRGWGSPGRNEQGQYVGIAPGANLVSIKVSDSTGMAHISDVIQAIEWATEHRKQYNLRVLNLSLASTISSSYMTDMLDAAVELAWLKGLVVVVANGNGGPNAPITSPANDPFVISVGATDDLGTASTADDRLAGFSSYGLTVDRIAKPDLVAPGRHIVSALSSRTDPLGLQFPQRIVSDAYISLSGTSASAPVVSGVVAQILQARPDLTPGQVKWLLTHTALAVAGNGTGAGYPRVGDAVRFSGPIGSSNTRLRPNLYLLLAYASQKGLVPSGHSAVSWDNVSWDNVSWDNVSWDNVSWDNVSWNSVSWNSVSWNSVAWSPAD
ncbi:MAG TPA: S8 family peptidase [Chloroflexota bacterium]|nr:S8 family peptidase [Chloroflexota bacterium]